MGEVSPAWDPLRAIHFQDRDPGTSWVKDGAIAIDVEPGERPRKNLTPNVLRLPGGGYRMYYTVSNPERELRKVAGAIMSAVSSDGLHWKIEPGERLTSAAAHGAARVLAPDVVPLPDGRYRMYVQAINDGEPARVLSAISQDGLRWTMEEGVRFGDGRATYGTPRCIYIDPPAGAKAGLWCRLYCHHYGVPMRTGLDAANHIVSAISSDGLHFEAEPGVRIKQKNELQDYAVYAPEIIRLGDGTYRMYYGGWKAKPLQGRIFSARSNDGLNWIQDDFPCVDLGAVLDVRHVSEPCVIDLPDGRHRLFYEACDAEQRWRILSATSRH